MQHPSQLAYFFTDYLFSGRKYRLATVWTLAGWAGSWMDSEAPRAVFAFSQKLNWIKLPLSREEQLDRDRQHQV